MEGCTHVEALLRSLCGFNIFWPKGCFEFGCLPPLCSGHAPIIPLRRVCRCSGLPALLGSCDVSHCLRACKERCSSGGPTPPLSQPPTMALYTLSHSHSSPFRLSPAHPTLVLSLGLTSEAWASAPSPYPCRQINISGWGAEGCNADLLCRLPFICLPRSGCRALLQGSKAPSQSSLISPPVRRLSWVQEHFLLHSSLPEVQAPSSSFFFFPFVLFGYMEVFLSFQKSKVFCWCSVTVLCE